MTANTDIESKLAQKISVYLREERVLPHGHDCVVHLYRGDRKKRRDAEFETNWDPSKDSIQISFSPIDEEEELGRVSASSSVASPKPTEDPLLDLLRALDRAERRPGYEFVSLKWFRDTALLHEGFSWVKDNLTRHDVLREAIDRRWILTSKIANPRSPHFPVTAIRLNRQMPEVNTALGSLAGSPFVFRPVSIRGESLSATVLHDRR